MTTLIFGKNSQVGKELLNFTVNSEIDCTFYNSKDLNFNNNDQIQYVLNKIKPDIIVNLAAFTDVDASEENYVYQRVGLDGSQAVSNFEPGDPPAPFVDNATDFIWQMEQGGADQIGEGVEHLLHTVTNVILYLSFPEEWDYNNPSSQLSLAMQESID